MTMLTSRYFKRTPFCAVLCLLGALLWNGEAEALPFNQDMVGTQLGNGTVMRPGAEGAVSVGQGERWVGVKREDALKLTNPVPSSPSSVAKGKRLYHVNCSPCHGRYIDDKFIAGAVSQQLPGPNLSLPYLKDRPDAHFFQFIHFGGMAIMPAYGWKFSIEEHWDIVNYIRAIQAQATESGTK